MHRPGTIGLPPNPTDRQEAADPAAGLHRRLVWLMP